MSGQDAAGLGPLMATINQANLLGLPDTKFLYGGAAGTQGGTPQQLTVGHTQLVSDLTNVGGLSNLPGLASSYTGLNGTPEDTHYGAGVGLGTDEPRPDLQHLVNPHQ